MAKIIEVKYKSPEWYAMRKTHIGGSDAACILGYDKYRSRLDLWNEMTGKAVKERKVNALMDYGTKAEEPLAKLFALDFQQYEVSQPKDIVFVNDTTEYQSEYQMASLDLLLEDKATNELGFGEIKTVNDIGGKLRKEWTMNKIPQKYYCQILHYFAVNEEFKFAYIMAHIKSNDGAMPYAETIYRTVRREEVLLDIEYLMQKENEFIDYVNTRTKPNEIINF